MEWGVNNKKILKKILLADDVELFLELEKTFFHRQGFELLVARTGREAYDKAVAERPDLVFMDLFMPQMNGDEACRLLKADPAYAAIPVVMVTQGGREEELQRCRLAGCDDIVLKPINRHHFLATARKFLAVADRAAPRVRARLLIHHGPQFREPLTGYSVNISTGGVFLETEKILPPDTALVLEFNVPSNPPPVIRCRGRVAWVNSPDKILNPRLPVGMGLQFLDLGLNDLESVREFIKQQCLSPDE
jgi:uncharacterized protein (TIGR02266 family)